MTIAKRWFGPIRSSRTDVNGTLYTNGQGTCCGCPYYVVENVASPTPDHTWHAEGTRANTGMLPLCSAAAFQVFGFGNDPFASSGSLKSASNTSAIGFYNPIEQPVLRVEIDSLPASIQLNSGGHDYEVFGWDTFNGTYDYTIKRSQWGCLMARAIPTVLAGAVGCGSGFAASTSISYANAVERNGTPYDVTLIMRIFYVVKRPVISTSPGPQNSFGEVSVTVSFCLAPSFIAFVLGDPMPALPMVCLEDTPGAGMYRALTYDAVSQTVNTTRIRSNYVSDTAFSLDATNMLTGITGQLVEQCVNGTCADGPNAGTITVSVFDNA
jgi:hypothetical protein